jgi:hypothetical protein
MHLNTIQSLRYAFGDQRCYWQSEELEKYGDSPQWCKWYVIVHMAYVKALLARSESIRHSRICLNNL